MRSLGLCLVAASLSHIAVAFEGGHLDLRGIHKREVQKRNIVYDGQISDSYDFIIIGGGTAGLALASRLSDDSNTTVLVLEAGDTGDAIADRINIPIQAYLNGLPGSSYDWQYTTVKQPNAGDRVMSWPRGKVLGGSSAMNGMYQVRPSKLEVDTWASLVDGGDKWDWEALFEEMNASETFTPPSDEIQAIGNIQYKKENHGTNGPIHATYPGFLPPVVGNWTTTLGNIGVAVAEDAYGGDAWGAYIATSSINPTNWTRSYSRSGYIDPLPPRPNLSVLPNATVTRIIFDTSNKNNLTATGVEWASGAGAPRSTVNAKKEVILAGGAIGSPHVLLHSGVGPSDVLSAAGVDVVLDLPGVGQHVQDHISTQVSWKTTAATEQSISAENTANGGTNSPEFLSFINSATAYVNITDLLGDSAAQFKQQVLDALDSSTNSLVPSSSAEVKKGYQTIYKATADFLSSPVGQVEILLSLSNGPVDGSNTLGIQAALQHPFSHGRIYISNNDPFTPPVIDPQYLSHSADLTIIREGLKLARKIGNTEPLKAVIGDEITPGSAVQSDEDWEKWLINQVGTEYHPSCSLAMLPREQGGVVDGDLKVYGTANVRVVDASVWAGQFSAHLQAPVYGLAEQAAKFIRATYNGVGWPSKNSSSSSNSSSSTTSTGSRSTTSAQPDKNAALALSPHVFGGSAALALVGVLATLVL
ncbi:GMC oxidoreductase [Trametes elegans]|nr:GMC oxidoreductase [Trametes elegans]